VPLAIGKGRILREGNSVALLSLGTRLAESLKAADELAAHGLSATVADARFAKPIDCELVSRLVHEHPVLITIEEGAIGGFATQVMTYLAKEGLLSNGTIVRPMFLPDRFVAHGAPGEQYEDAGLNAHHIVAEVLTALKLDRKVPELKAKA